MDHSFNKEDIYTAGGFVLDSLEGHQFEFVAVTSDEDFGAGFLTQMRTAYAAIKPLTGSGLNIGVTAQATQQLYERMDNVKAYLDRLEIRLGLVDAKKLTVPVKDFGIAKLRREVVKRNAEGTVQGLAKLNAAIGANLSLLEPRGQSASETQALTDAENEIAADNRKQNKAQNAGTESTVEENALLTAFDTYLKKVMSTGRKLYKKNKQARRQYEQKAILARMHAGERPKDRPGPGEE